MNLSLANIDCVGQDEPYKVAFLKVSAGKELDPNYLGQADNESHGGKIPHELFCVTGSDSELIDTEDLY